ncbi:MAG: FtsX-like permease family protein [Chitinivibrionales bacterium]|nr:FtsX-like permease family protein [Chitinivibrionales bacterium]
MQFLGNNPDRKSCTMNFTAFRISLRNVLRQKRRSLLLGIAIAFGAMILVVANSFSRGISDVLFNQIVVYVSGHISLNFSERGNYFRQVFHDRERIVKAIDTTFPEVESQSENIGIFGRAIGNGKADNVIIVGMDLNAEVSDKELQDAERNFKMIEGKFEDLLKKSVENPVILAKEKAEYLNVKMGDKLRVRFTNVIGQEQAARLTVVGIFKPSNIFMATPVFVELKYLKPLLGYAEYDIAPVYINIEDPRRNAARLADSLHANMRPATAAIHAQEPASQEQVSLAGFKDDSASLARINALLSPAAGKENGPIDNESVIASRPLARKLELHPGDTLTFRFYSKHDSGFVVKKTPITHIADFPGEPSALALVNPTDFYRIYYHHWPEDDTLPNAAMETSDAAFAAVLAPQWELMDRARSTSDMQDLFREMGKLKTRAVIVDVRSMYETASAVLKLESALNIITVIAVIVLFAIILIGVVNTLRMSIKERTREIGTMRAIGMHKGSVLSLFILESVILAFFASIAGAILAFACMWLLSQPTIDAGENPMGMLLVEGHLQFSPSGLAIGIFVALICAITALSALFPSLRAANMQPTRALHHVE